VPDNKPRTEADAGKPPDQQFRVAAPQLGLPKGGGAIRGIGEKFAANPVTGTGSLTVPIYTSPGRSGFGPQFSLSYNSGGGNGPFGFGWSLALPAITRKTGKGLPQYVDSQESDIFILSGAEDLMPALNEVAGQWTRDIVASRTVYSKQYAIHRYRPRVEGLFARIERWINLSDPQDTFWRSISKDNITTWYGKTPESRIADPSDPSRVFSWLICESYDDKGNAVSYQYKPENSDKVDLTQAAERNRNGTTRSAQRYIKHVLYGNRTPYFPDLTATKPVALPTDWCFELVFDYGEHDLANPVPQETGVLWDCRLDAFSTYRSTFEVRTYRLCRRALMFHHFGAEINVGLNCLVRSTDLAYTPAVPPVDPTQPFYTYLLSATQTGYRRNGPATYLPNSLPPLEFTYTVATVDEDVREVDTQSLENLPYGIDSNRYRWVDLDGEGLSGILTEQAGSWFYKANLSPAIGQTIDGVNYTAPQFAPVELVARQPSLAALSSGRQQLMDLSGDGQLDLVQFDGPTPGFFERTEDQDWEPFATFPSLPVLDWRNPNLKFIDLTGDGFPDLLISEDDAFWWHTSLAADGFGPAQRVPQALDEEKGPKLVFSDGTESIFLADMSGDGLTDLVRIRSGEVCYWPNLGYGRFGAKIAMDQAPRFESRDLFDGRRIRMADIDGTGTADIIYFASGPVQLYFNQSGNAWGDKRVLSHYPAVDSVSSATAMDLLGNGTACLVWSSSLPGNARRPMRYIDLMGGQKPHLLVGIRNNLGAETIVQYAASTKFYVADKLTGTPWVTRLPFPVHVVEQVQTYDYISRNLFVTSYSYHHGYFDGVEREFRGFGRVDLFDTEEFATLTSSSDFPQPANIDAASNVPPVCTKTWFHTGAFFGEASVSKYMEHEYYNEGDSSEAIAGLTVLQLESMLLDDTVLPTTILLPDGSRLAYDLSGEEMREACRALRGSILRQETYALDGTDESDRPYSVSERNYTIEVFQPQGPNRYGVFFAHPRETVDFHYERKLYKVNSTTLADPSAPPPAITAADPRVTHTLTLAVDPFGNVLQSASVGYGRRYLDPALTLADQTKQIATLGATLSTYTENTFTNPVLADNIHRNPLPAQSSTYELIQVQPDAIQADVTNLFGFEELQTKVKKASDGTHDILYENLHPTLLNAGEPYRRLIGRSRTLYRPDSMAPTLLVLGTLESLALPGNTYKLAFTPGLISQVYQRGGTALLPIPASVLGSVAADGGGYADLDGDGHWWIPSGRIYYALAPATSVQEKTEALAHFFLPRRFEDAFGNATSVDYDKYDLLVVKTTDAVQPVGNTVTAVNDYRVLAPSLTTDPNLNQAAVSFDVLGMVVATAVMGKTTEILGDLLSGFDPDPLETQIDTFYAADDPHTLAGALLGNATTRVVYDVQRFLNSRIAAPNDPSKWEPTFAATLARETHVSDLLVGQQTKIQITFSYSDGYGREIQKKIQSEPGPVVDKGPIVNPRWVGSGWTIFNNKGKPVRQYEPFFSQLPTKGHQFEFGMQVGVSPILFYDPVERVVATAHPNHTYEKVVFDPWHQATWDVNDTVLQADPTTDLDGGSFFKRLPTSDYSPTWFAPRIAKPAGDPDHDAAVKASAHAITPALAYFDTLGRTFLTIADNAGGGQYQTHIELDIQNNQRAMTDALGREVMTYDYDVPGSHIHQASMEAGERWMLNDVTGKAIRAWNSRGHNFRTTYDVLRRPLGQFVLGTDLANSDARTTAAEVLYETIDYGEGQPSGQALNLRTRIFHHHDSAGVVINMVTVNAKTVAFDFKGNLLGNSRQFVQDHKALPDWSKAAPAFLPDVFVSTTQYDALNRTVAATTPDASVLHPTYNEANLLETVSINLQGAGAATSFVTNIDYNAKGQRVLIEYGNSTSTTYIYDPLTFRLEQLTTVRAGFPANQQTVQDLAYTYDPIGNITHIQDNADIQNVVYFNNRRVEPSADYTYDAIYRLILASGREQLGLSAGVPLPPTPTSYNDVPRIHLPHPGDGNAMGTYSEQYRYDAVGNFSQFVHSGNNPFSAGWTRSYTYNEASQLEPAKFSNRLTRTTVSGGTPLIENYTYDLHGNMIGMPHLQLMQWDFKDQLLMTQRQAVNASDTDGTLHQGERTYYVYNAAGERVRKTTESAAAAKMKERFYLGWLEVYREYDGAGNTTLERQSLNVLDDKRRIALVETKMGVPPSPAIRYQFDNHLGTACLELDDNAAVISYEEYYPYGSTSYQAGRTVAEVSLKRYRYTGKERDEETGFNYHGARYYAMWIARWTSCDPNGLADGVDLYAYTRDNPIRLVDPGGRQSSDDDTKNAGGDDAAAPGISTQPGPSSLSFLHPGPRLKLDPANFWYSSISQGTGVLPPGALDVELGGVGVLAGTSGLGLPKEGIFGLQSGQLGIRKALGESGFDLGVVGGGSYTGGTAPASGSLSAAGTLHYGWRADDLPNWLQFLDKVGLGDLRPGLGGYAQVGAAYQTSDKSTGATASFTGVAALEREEAPTGVALSAIVLNPNFSYAKEGQLTRGPNLANLTTVGGTAGVQLAFGEHFTLLGEGNILYEHGSPLGSSDQSASALRYTAGLVGTYSWLGHGDEAQSSSVAFGAWYFHESGSVSGTSTADSPTGSFNTSGVLFGAVFGYRTPAVFGH
jgi:RHS repeat-associated protein